MQRGAIHRVSYLSLHLEIGFDFGNSLNSKPLLRGQDGDLRGLKVFFIPGNDMISRNCLDTCELNVVLKVGQCRGERVGDKFLVERDQTKPLCGGLSISAGLPFIGNSQPREVKKRDGQCRSPAFVLWRSMYKIQDAQAALVVGRFVLTSMQTLTSTRIFIRLISRKFAHRSGFCLPLKDVRDGSRPGQGDQHQPLGGDIAGIIQLGLS